MSLKVYARFLQKLHRFRREHVLADAASVSQQGSKRAEIPREEAYALDAKVKVKLPCRHVLRVVAVLVGERESYLDDLE